MIQRDFKAPDRGEHFLTAEFPASEPGDGEMEGFMGAYAERLAAGGIEPVQEKLYGSTAAKPRVLAARDRAFRRCDLDPALPLTYVEGCPRRSRTFAGVQVWGLSPPPGSGPIVVGVPSRAGAGPGRGWRAGGRPHVYFPAIDGLPPAGAPPSSPAEQAARMFARAAKGLEEAGFAYGDAVRTWIYLSRLLQWYPDFNRVRTGHLDRLGLLGAARRAPLAASTGIQGRGAGEACQMDVLALAPGNGVSVRAVGNPLQNEPIEYGSAFSRAVIIASPGMTTIHVSGTAAIGERGESLHPGDPDSQARATVERIRALLRGEGAGLEDVVQATVFCKNERALEAYDRLDCPVPAVRVLADVCRPELLIEIEAVAVVG